MPRLASLLLAAALLCASAAGQAAEQKVLVLLDDPALEQSHSVFLKSLESRGYQVSIKPITDKALQLKSWDDWLFDKLIIFGSSKGELLAPAASAQRSAAGGGTRTTAALHAWAPVAAELGGAIDVGQVVEFVDAGHDLLLAVDSGVSEELRELAQELGIDVDARWGRGAPGCASGCRQGDAAPSMRAARPLPAPPARCTVRPLKHTRCCNHVQRQRRDRPL